LLAPADRTRTLETDGGLESGYFSIDAARLLEAEVWGQGFPAPLFADASRSSQRILKDKHLKLRLRKGMQRLDAIQFNFGTSSGESDGQPTGTATVRVVAAGHWQHRRAVGDGSNQLCLDRRRRNRRQESAGMHDPGLAASADAGDARRAGGIFAC
jgi:hypothetical protein